MRSEFVFNEIFSFLREGVDHSWGYVFFQYARNGMEPCIDGKLFLVVIKNSQAPSHSESSPFGSNSMIYDKP